MSKLCDFIDIGKIGVMPNKTPEEYFNYFSIPDFDTNKTHSITLGSEIDSNKFLINSESLLISKLNPRKRRVWKAIINNNFKSISSTEFVNVIMKSSSVLDYFYYKLQSNDIYSFLESIAIGSTNSHVRFRPERLYDIEVDIPSPPHQRKIARILTTIDNVIEKTESAIAKYKLIKQGMMHDLFTRGIDSKTGKLRPTKEEAPHLYKKTELGWIPKEWEVEELEVTSSDSNYSFTGGPFGSDLQTKDYTTKGVRIIQLQNIGDGYFNDEYKIYTSERKANQLSSCNIFPNDIIIAKMADPVARACIIPDFNLRYLMASDGIRLMVDKGNFNTLFVLESINFYRFRKRAKALSTGSTRERIGLTELRKIQFTSPRKLEQDMISKRLAILQNKIETEQKQLAKLQKLKQGLMQDLLTGKKEVEPDEEDYNNE